MQPITESGISFILLFQNLGDWLIAPMRFFSELGTEDFFFLVLPLIYWSVNSALGLRVGMILVTSSMVNYIFKLAFAGPRPYWVDSQVRGLWPETSFGIPSGHAQHAMTVWGVIGYFARAAWVRVVCILLILLIGVSRLYLGSHFLHDVIAGWLLGAALLWAFIRYWDAAAAWLARKSLKQQIGLAFAASLLFIAAGWAATAPRLDYQIPAAWIENALRDSDLAPDPVDPNGIFTSAGTFFGLAAGLAWINSRGGYRAEGPLWKRAVRYLIGLIGVLILWMGLGAVFPRGDDLLVYLLRFIRYALVGWWVTGGAPWAFNRFKLVESRSDESLI